MGNKISLAELLLVHGLHQRTVSILGFTPVGELMEVVE